MKSNQTTQLIPPTPPACPEWCSLPAGHPYDDLGLTDSGELEANRVHHTGSMPHDECWISQTESNVGGVITLDAARLIGYHEDAWGSTADVRGAAAELVRLASVFDQSQVGGKGVPTVDTPPDYVGGWHVQDGYGGHDVYVIPRRFVEVVVGEQLTRLSADQARALGVKLIVEADTVEDITTEVYV